jgi:hypothetical protein
VTSLSRDYKGVKVNIRFIMVNYILDIGINKVTSTLG